MREYYKEKIKNLVALRNNLFTSVIVLTSGVVGLFFINQSFVKLLPFMVIGGYFDFVFLLNLLSINNKIDKILEGLKWVKKIYWCMQHLLF